MNLTKMTLLTRMIIGWVGPLAWIVAQILDYKNLNPLIFLGGLLLAYWLRYVVHPKIPRSNWPRRAAAVNAERPESKFLSVIHISNRQ